MKYLYASELLDSSENKMVSMKEGTSMREGYPLVGLLKLSLHNVDSRPAIYVLMYLN